MQKLQRENSFFSAVVIVKEEAASKAWQSQGTLAMSPVSHSSEKKDDAQDDFLCGVVEGFYGRPWTTEQRKDLFAKMQACRIHHDETYVIIFS